jgi:hypothetical protein
VKRQVHFIKNLKVFNTNLESKFKIKEKNQKVQNKVEGIISRLRSLEYTQQ